jgi:hypothetical protein
MRGRSPGSSGVRLARAAELSRRSAVAWQALQRSFARLTFHLDPVGVFSVLKARVGNALAAFPSRVQ